MTTSGPLPQSDDLQVWKAIITGILEPRGISADQYYIKLDKGKVVIDASNKACSIIKLALASAFKTRKSFKYDLEELPDVEETSDLEELDDDQEELKELSEEIIVPKFITTPDVDYENVDAWHVLSQIFDPKLLLSCFLTKELINLFDIKDQKIVRIPVASGPYFSDICEGIHNALTAAMIGGGIQGMNKAYINQGPKIAKNPSEVQFELSKEFEDILKFSEDENEDEEWLEFNYGKLLKVLKPKPPKIDIEKIADSHSRITIDQKAGLDHLASTFHEGFILQPVEEGFKPIFLPKGKLSKANNMVSLVLDCSQSLENVFSQYMDQIKAMADQIVDICTPGDIIRIANFSNRVETKIFTIESDKTITKKRIHDHLKNLKSGGVTFLYGAIESELKAMSSAEDYTRSLVAFTDGFNNMNAQGHMGNDQTSPAYQLEDERFLNDFEAFMKSKPADQVPSVFTLGYGPDYNPKVLKKCAERSGMHHSHVDELNALKDFYVHLKQVTQPRTLIRFQLNNEAERFIPVYEGSLAFEPKITIAPGESFSINGIQYQAQLSAPQLSDDESEEMASSNAFLPMRNGQRAAAQAAQAQQSSVAWLDLAERFSRCTLV